ncbi:glycosyl transferase family 2 [Cytobacillus firmus]|uniref:Glycosyl transferase family 2 n=3 Tax=Bacillaceae TaxID=186817 RepID=A0A366JM32_CYTFI|nr:glycosyl transferase family 2 [Cytobacillus firmus]TDX39525.1 glycosyl transferase family 2 [Cytobacillus oceanisediminis]
MSTMRKVSVIIPIKNEEEKLEMILNEVKKLNPLEIITVINGSIDKSEEIAQAMECKVIVYEDALGHDIGRAIGAFYAKGDILLFLDGDILISNKNLYPFIDAIEQGHDIALNNLELIMNTKERPHSVSVVKKALNELFGYDELTINSMVAVPHAISRHALQEVNWRSLANPPLAQAIAMSKKLSIVAPEYVDVISRNKIRPDIHIEKSSESPYNWIEDVIFGDHLSAVHYLITEKGKRGGHPDKRYRTMLQNIKRLNAGKTVLRSAVICDEGKLSLEQLTEVIRTLKESQIDEILFISSRQEKIKMDRLRDLNVMVIPLFIKGDIFLNRAIGAVFASGESVLFLDEKSILPAEDWEKLFKEAENGADLVLLNEVNYLDESHPLELINSMKYFLNLAAKRPDLWNNGLAFQPHVISRKALQLVGNSSIMIPPVAYLKIMEHSLPVSVVQVSTKLPYMDDAIKKEELIGDCIEGLSYFFSKTNERGGFSDGNRKRRILDELNDNGREIF